MKKWMFFTAIIALVVAGCYKDKADEINIGAGLFDPCDTTHNVSYQNHIKVTLENYCYSCHSGANPSSGIHLDTYNDLYSWYVTGDLYGCVYRQAGYNPMPPSFALDSCHMKQFGYWIAAGAPNN